MPRIVLHAPNVHVGGGKILLEALVTELAEQRAEAVVIHDRRFALHRVHAGLAGYAIPATALSRLKAEWLLYRLTRPTDVVLCFGNLPPLLRLPAWTCLFLQNRLLVSPGSYLDRRDLRMRLQIGLEKLWLNGFKRHVDTFYVQTPSMAAAVRRHLGEEIDVLVKPFLDRAHLSQNLRAGMGSGEQRFDFIYPATGYHHKNHKTLVEAWSLLSAAGLRPSLALTLSPRTHAKLLAWVERRAHEERLDIVNLGEIRYEDLLDAYRRSGALIFPSRLESLGLPLVEASALGMPIVAAELDYVRDVVEPAEVFDPDSPRSIAEAVQRFADRSEAVQGNRKLVIDDSQGFLREIVARAPADGGDSAIHEDAAP